MKKLLIYLKDYIKECVLAPLFKMLEASFELLVPLVIASIIDKGIGNSDKSHIIKMVAVLVGLAVIGLVCSLTAQFFSAKAAVGFASKLRHSLFEHLLGLSFFETDILGTSTMITRMTSDINQAQTGVNMFLRLFLRSPFVVFGAMIMAFMIDFNSALIFAAAIAILLIIIFRIMLSSIKRQKIVQGNLDGVLQTTRENLSGVRVIRAFCKENEEIEKFNKRNTLLLSAQKKAVQISSLMNPLTYIIINISAATLIWTGALRANIGELSQGQVVALYNYMAQILVELIKLADLIITINKSLASAKRISDVFEIKSSMEEKDELTENSSDDDYSVVFKNVSFIYKNAGGEALSDISFSVKKGETVGIIGGTGSGKTTLVNMIPRFYDATSGEIIVDGINVKDYPTNALREQVGIVMQKAVLFKGTIRDNLKWRKKDSSDEELLEAVKIAQAADVLKSKNGLDSDVEQSGRNFSGGQRQRLTIARALVGKPDILILDDSSSALDYSTDANLRKAISGLSYNPTVFIVSQRASSVKNADIIIVLDDGKIAGKGTHSELIESCEVYKEIYYSQFSENPDKEARI
ncbi:MAG TPA: ABC transporter ATP-binding protein [Oscillospiraceae bacterium]|nr:ABC transporter ATP-binding protein [Oscillospiraceae bacterium]